MNKYRRKKYLQDVESAVLSALAAYKPLRTNYLCSLLYASFNIPADDVKLVIKSLYRIGIVKNIGTESDHVLELDPAADISKLKEPHILLEGQRFKSHIDNYTVWRVLSGGDLMSLEGSDDVHDIIVDQRILIPKDEWVQEFFDTNLCPICSFCGSEMVKHRYTNIYPICSKCFRFLKEKPSIEGRKHIANMIEDMRMLDDIITEQDMALYEAIQNVIEDADSEEHAEFLNSQY